MKTFIVIGYFTLTIGLFIFILRPYSTLTTTSKEEPAREFVKIAQDVDVCSVLDSTFYIKTTVWTYTADGAINSLEYMNVVIASKYQLDSIKEYEYGIAVPLIRQVKKVYP